MSGPPALAGRVDFELEDRVRRARGEAERLLGAAEPGAEPEPLTALIGRLSRRLSELEGSDPEGLITEHGAALERLDQRYEARLQALRRASGAVTALRGITAPAEILAAAPAALCEASMLERVILSLIGERRMTASAAHFAGDEGGARRVLHELSVAPIALEHPLIEVELLRRRRATIVVDAHLHPRVDRRLSVLMGWSSYVAAPLVAGSRVFGVLHADRGPESGIDVLDRDVVWRFATALAHAYETAGLIRTLRSERERMRQFLEWTSARSSELTIAPIRLATLQRSPVPPPAPGETPGSAAGRDDRAVFDGLLTRRELDVLRLLADGQTNRAIAQALVIADGTVKFHVNSILRKLRVANRAEAVSRYLRLLGARAPR